MKFQEFLEVIVKKVKEHLENAQKVEIQQVRKNNDVLLHGLTIHSAQTNIIPTIYMEPFYELYRKGIGLDAVTEKICKVYKESLPRENINMDFFKDFEKVKDRIVYRLIHAGRNKELLDEIPHIPFWDLAICFSYSFWSEELGDGMILIRNEHMESWKVNYSQLMRLAEKNTPRLFPVSFYGMNEVLKQLQLEIDLSEEIEEQLYVLTNQQKTHGAAVILYPQTLIQIAKQLESDFYILPSSIHEVLVLKADRIEDRKAEAQILHEMIAEVNHIELGAEEVLSDYPYFYDSKERKLMQIF